VILGLRAKALFQASPSLKGLPPGSFRYSEPRYILRSLPPEIVSLFERMSEGIDSPRLSYQFQSLTPGGRFGHGRWHCDGREEADEIHRLLTVGGVPTEGDGGQILHAGTVWEYSGAYRHRARPVQDSCWRLMLRVSETTMMYRNHWRRA